MTFAPRLVALLRPAADGGCSLHAPTVALWLSAPAPGTVITPGAWLGDLDILGVRHRLEAPAGTNGIVTQTTATAARHPVAYTDLLLTLAPLTATTTATSAAATTPTASSTSLIIRAPTSGRIYLRPSPDKPPFVSPGDRLTAGTTLCLLEVMKTFNRVHYGGPDLPDPAILVSVLRQNEDDVDPNTPLFEISPGGTEST